MHRRELKARLLAFVGGDTAHSFDALARDVARYQARSLPSYGRLASSQTSPIQRWQDAPLVPTEIFREIDLSPPDLPAQATFLTSGTTGVGKRGMRRVPDLEIYEAACQGPFREAVLRGEATPRPWLSLIPSASELPDSSLSHMVSFLGTKMASSVTYGATGLGLDTVGTRGWLDAVREPYVLLTTSFALVQFLQSTSAVWQAPKGSRMMLTGGFKGRTREIAEGDLMELIAGRLGLGFSQVVGEYGMTELTSQAYGRPFRSPAWLRLRVLDPRTLTECVPGEEGLVGFFDLLNLDNVSAILTSDVGSLDTAGALTLTGRAPQAVLRGCSLRAEEWSL